MTGWGTASWTRVSVLVLVLTVAIPSMPVDAGGHVGLQVYEHLDRVDNGYGFGQSLAWHGDTLLVGADDDDAVHVVRLVDGLWTVVQVLEGPQYSDFGYSLAVSGDLLVVGAPYDNVDGPGDGAAYVYQHNGAWGLLGRVTPGGEDSYRFGSQVDVDGDWVAIGAPGVVIGTRDITSEGTVHMFKVGATIKAEGVLRSASLLEQQAFGFDLDILGSRLLVGAPGWFYGDALMDGAAHVYERSGNTWSLKKTLTAGTLQDGSGYGSAVALRSSEAVVCNDATLIAGSDDDRALYVYGVGGWTVKQTIADVSCTRLTSDETTMLTVGYIRPYLRAYTQEGTKWVQQDMEIVSQPTGVAWRGDIVAIGYPHTYNGHVHLLGHNHSPTASMAKVTTKSDLDGDGVETVTLDGSNSTDEDGDALRHYWYDGGALLGTGETLTLELPIGTHEIDLIVADPLMGTDRTRTAVEVRPTPPPTAEFSWLPERATTQEPFRFVDESTSSYGHVIAWDWDFDGDGIRDASGPTPSWTFDTSGRHDVTLTVRTDLDTEASATKRVTVLNLDPVADAGMDQIIEDDGTGQHLVDLDGTDSHDPDGDVRSYRWVRNGLQFSTEPAPSVLLGLGVHDIDLTVQDNKGATDKDRVTILILDPAGNGTSGGAPPTAAFTWKADSGPPTHAARFEDQSSDRDGRVVMWWYDVDDDGTVDATEPDPLLGMGGYGSHDVRLTVTDDEGQQTHVVHNVFLKNNAPTAAIGARATEAYVGQKVVFVDESTDPEGPLTSRAWEFGDGATSTEGAPAHIYDAAGSYTVRLTVTDDGGQTDTATIQVTVRDVPPGTTVPAVAGSPVEQQAEDSPLSNDNTDQDPTGNGNPGDPASNDQSGKKETSKGGASTNTKDTDPNPAATLVDPERPWLWIGVSIGILLVVAVVWAVARR